MAISSEFAMGVTFGERFEATVVTTGPGLSTARPCDGAPE
jgi:hypothetical protein